MLLHVSRKCPTRIQSDLGPGVLWLTPYAEYVPFSIALLQLLYNKVYFCCLWRGNKTPSTSKKAHERNRDISIIAGTSDWTSLKEQKVSTVTKHAFQNAKSATSKLMSFEMLDGWLSVSRDIYMFKIISQTKLAFIRCWSVQFLYFRKYEKRCLRRMDVMAQTALVVRQIDHIYSAP